MYLQYFGGFGNAEIMVVEIILDDGPKTLRQGFPAGSSMNTRQRQYIITGGSRPQFAARAEIAQFIFQPGKQRDRAFPGLMRIGFDDRKFFLLGIDKSV